MGHILSLMVKLWEGTCYQETLSGLSGGVTSVSSSQEDRGHGLQTLWIKGIYWDSQPKQQLTRGTYSVAVSQLKGMEVLWSHVMLALCGAACHNLYSFMVPSSCYWIFLHHTSAFSNLPIFNSVAKIKQELKLLEIMSTAMNWPLKWLLF